jgi:hypothetical protein
MLMLRVVTFTYLFNIIFVTDHETEKSFGKSLRLLQSLPLEELRLLYIARTRFASQSAKARERDRVMQQIFAIYR